MGRKRERGRIGKVVSEDFGFHSCFLSVLLFLSSYQHRRVGWMICFFI
jgi:hypothetical protein